MSPLLSVLENNSLRHIDRQFLKMTQADTEALYFVKQLYYERVRPPVVQNPCVTVG